MAATQDFRTGRAEIVYVPRSKRTDPGAADVERINQYQFYEIGVKLSRLRSPPGENVDAGSAFHSLFNARTVMHVRRVRIETGGIAMWKTRNSSPYLQPGRLNDVLAAIQMMALNRYYRASVDDWAELISNKESGPRWRKLFDDHPEFFRPSVLHPGHYALVWRRALPRRCHYITKVIITSEEYDKLLEGEKKYYSRAQVPESQIKTLMDLAITLHQRAIDQARDWRWWVAPVIAAASSFIGALVGGLAKLKLGS